MKNRSNTLIALRMLLCFTFLCGGLYPVVVTLLAHGLFPQQANGSLFFAKGQIAGSRLLAYKNPGEGYFHFRPSACDYSTLPGSAANFAPSSAAWRDSVQARRCRFRKENNPADSSTVPVEMLCASASGLDPHISPAAAHMQVARIIAFRQKSPAHERRLNDMIDAASQPWLAGLAGPSRINVAELNFILDNTAEFSTLKK
jgi:potassium-transporting ATPase KdpC subunit